MKTLVVYTSQTGFTKKYAKWLSDEMEADMYDLKDVQKKDDSFYSEYGAIVYAGWAMASKIVKSNWFLKKATGWKDKKLALICVGGCPGDAPECNEMMKTVITEEQKSYIKAFYCQGGFNYDKMNAASKLAMKMFVGSLKKKPDEKSHTMAEMISKGYDISDVKYIQPVVDYLPQIHEGPNVRAMEKRGIKTDKGDWNRFVKWVNNQIKSLKNLINSISETYKEIKTENEKSQIGFNELIAAIDNYCNSLEKRYGKVRAVKARAEVNSFIEKYKVSSLDDFSAVTKTLYSKVSDVQNEVKASDTEMKEINDTLRDYKEFKELKPVYDEWYSIKRSGKKDKFASAHDGELRRYRMLRRVLSEKYPDMNIPIKALCQRRDELLNTKKVQKDKLDEVRNEAKTAYRLEKQISYEYRRRNKNRIKERGVER